MGKSDFLTPKAIANRIKSKGLQKLRWYCQMCQKQCRDEFRSPPSKKRHQKRFCSPHRGGDTAILDARTMPVTVISSDLTWLLRETGWLGFTTLGIRMALSVIVCPNLIKRQLLLASENPQQFMDYFSEEFRNDFLELLRRRFGTKRVHNNIVYNEYISHREHIHMNATQWETLTDFTKWLGREGLCKVDETPKGWYIQYIDRDPETIRRQLELEKKKKQDLDDEEKTAKFIEEQVRRGLEGKEQYSGTECTEDNRKFSISETKESAQSSAQSKEKKKKKSALDEIMEEIIVKIITKKLGEKYHKKKGIVKEVIDKYTAVVKMIDSGDKLKLDQTHLETVIPAPGKRILVLNGGYRGNEGTLESINEKTFSATIVIETGPLKGRRVEGIQYEDFSKLA
ncbi:hypothetical protein H8958_020485 [Nasalis larvatus]